MNSAQHLVGKSPTSDERAVHAGPHDAEQMVQKIVQFRMNLQGRQREFEEEFNHYIVIMNEYRKKVLEAIMMGDTEASENCARTAAFARQSLQATNAIQQFMTWTVSHPESPNWGKDYVGE